MNEVKTSRPFQERFLDGFDRQLGREVQKVKPKRSHSLRKKYTTWALGAGLALGGGLSIPVTGHMHQYSKAATLAAAEATAQRIASQVAGGVQGVVNTVAESAAQAPAHIGTAMAEVPQEVAQIAEKARESFFNREVPFGSIIYNEAKKNNLPPELVAAVAHTESRFIPTARSQSGAVGLMQLVPRTGRWLGARDLKNPAENIMAGAKYLKYLSNRFGGNQEKAIAAYNAGEGNVRRFNGIPPFRETRDYVQRVRNFQRDLEQRLVGQVADPQGTAPAL
jgi:soluble lytic murein transglycosylase-like protein